MGVIQQSFNQAFSMAGLAKQLYQQSPGYQKKLEEKEFDKSKEEYQKAQEALASKKQQAGPLAQKDLENAQLQLGERRAAELLARGKYTEYANRVTNNAYAKAISSNPVSPFGSQTSPAYDEQRAQAANDRAENIARQVSEQGQREKDILRQLRGLLPLSQELVARHKEGIK